MIGAILQGFAIRGIASLNTQAFINRLALLSQQAYYKPYAREAIHQQIAIEIYNAFKSVPVGAHEQMASNLLSALVQYPVAAGQLRIPGRSQEWARRYPVFAPMIYNIAEVLMPGLNGTSALSFQLVPVTSQNQQFVQSPSPQPYLQPRAPLAMPLPKAFGTSPTPISQSSYLQKSASVGHGPSSGQANLPFRLSSPSRTQAPWQTSSYTRPEADRPAGAVEFMPRTAKQRQTPHLKESHGDLTSQRESGQIYPNLGHIKTFDGQFNIEKHSLQTP